MVSGVCVGVPVVCGDLVPYAAVDHDSTPALPPAPHLSAIPFHLPAAAAATSSARRHPQAIASPAAAAAAAVLTALHLHPQCPMV